MDKTNRKMADLPEITFDAACQVRCLPDADLQHTQTLSTECSAFTSQLSEFRSKVSDVVSGLSKEGGRVEREKLKAIGVRNRVEGEKEERFREAKALEGALAEAKMRLERHTQQLMSLEKVEAEQLAILEKLQNQ